MKKQAALIMAAVLAIAALGGCSSSSESTAAETTAQAAEEAEEEAEAEAEVEEEAEIEAEEESEGPVVVVADPDLGYPYQDLVLGDGSLDRVLESGKLVIGTSPDYAPAEFEDISSGESVYVGSDIELAKYIADELGVELEIRAMEFSAILQAVQSGTIDAGVSSFAYSDERNEAVGLSHRYNRAYSKGYGVLVPADLTSEYQTADDFAGKRIAAQNASILYTLVETELPDVDIQLCTSNADGALMVTSERVDGVAVVYEAGEILMKSYPELGMADFKFDREAAGNVICVKKGNDDLLNAINELIDVVENNGQYQQWRDESFELAQELGIEAG